MPSGIEAEQYPIYNLIQEHPKLEDIFLKLDFSYLASDRLSYRRSKYGGDKVFDINEEQIPGTGLFPKEAEKVEELITVCRDKKMSDWDIVHLFPALHISLFAHQLQFRESGESYSVHPMQMAIEAVRDHNADWQTAALCLLHDVKEDSKKYFREVKTQAVELIYIQLFRGENNENLEEARTDAQFLVRGMEALHKVAVVTTSKKVEGEGQRKNEQTSSSGEKAKGTVKDRAINLFKRKEKDATLETIKKLYSILLGDAKRRYTDVRIALVKLLDRKFNLETLQFMPPAKQIEKAQEAFIYITMAEAFHMYKLRDELAELAMIYLDPADSAFIKDVYRKNDSLKRVYDDNLVPLLIQVLDVQHILAIQLQTPGFFELYNASAGDVLANLQYLNLDIVLDDVIGEESNEWRNRAFSTIGLTAGVLGITDAKDINIEELKDDRRFVTARITVNGESDHRIDFIIRVSGRGEFVRSRTSIENIYPRSSPVFGDWEEWNRHERENVLDVYERFREARKLRDFGIFAEVAVAGQKIAFDKEGNRRYLSKDATIFDLVWMIYGDEVLRSVEVYIRSGKTTISVSRRDFGNIAAENIRIEGLRVWEFEPLKAMEVRPEDVRMSRTSLVRQSLIREMEGKVGVRERLHDDIEDFGYYSLQEDFRRAWTDTLGHEPLDIAIDRFFPVSPDAIIDTYADLYPDKAGFAYAIGSGRIPGSVYRRTIDAMVAYREDMVFLNLGLKDQMQMDMAYRILRESGISWDEMDPSNTERGEKICRFWFHESKLGSQEERMRKFSAIIERFQAEGILINFSWNKIPIIYPEIRESDIVRVEKFDSVI